MSPSRGSSMCRVCRRGIPAGERYCEAHAAASSDRDRSRNRRDNGLKSLYDSSQWRYRTRTYILRRDPFCRIAVLCGGRAPACDVDHIVRAEVYIERNGGNEIAFFDEQNLRGGCHACHAHKTALENSGQWNESMVESALATWGAG